MAAVTAAMVKEIREMTGAGMMDCKKALANTDGDMDKAVERLNKALGRKERIMVYGDYDVDGCTAVALVYKFLQQYYSNIDYYIPDRYEEG